MLLVLWEKTFRQTTILSSMPFKNPNTAFINLEISLHFRLLLEFKQKRSQEGGQCYRKHLASSMQFYWSCTKQKGLFWARTSPAAKAHQEQRLVAATTPWACFLSPDKAAGGPGTDSTQKQRGRVRCQQHRWELSSFTTAQFFNCKEQILADSLLSALGPNMEKEKHQ